MGTQNESDLKLAARRIAKIIKMVGFPVKFKRSKLINMFATYDTGFQFALKVSDVLYTIPPSIVEFCKWDSLAQEQILQITSTHNCNTQT